MRMVVPQASLGWLRSFHRWNSWFKVRVRLLSIDLILLQSKPRREYALWEILWVIIHFFVILFVIVIRRIHISLHLLKVVEPLARTLIQIYLCLRICFSYSGLSSISIQIVIRVIDYSLRFWISPLGVYIPYSLPFTVPVLGCWHHIRISVVERIQFVGRWLQDRLNVVDCIPA